MSGAPDVDALVIGAGIAGLAAAREFERRGCEVLLVDSSDVVGGVMRSDRVGDYVVERGPNTFQLKAPMRRALTGFGLEDEVVRAAPASRSRFLVRSGELVPVPLGPLGLAQSPLLSAAGKLRILREPFVAGGDGNDESVAEFVERRLGSEALHNLVGPFLTGVYAGDETELGAEAVFPALVEAEREHGSVGIGLIASALRTKAEDKTSTGTFSHSQGLGALAGAVAAGLRVAPQLCTRVASLRAKSSGFEVELEPDAPGAAATRLRARRVVVATPAFTAAPLVREFDSGAADWLAGVAYAPIATVALGAPRGAFGRTPEGFGFLVPRGEDPDLLGCLFMSELFEGRAPADHQLLHCILGGLRAPEALDLPDDVLEARAVEALDRLLGGVGTGPECLQVQRWPRAVAQPSRQHRARLRATRASLAACGRLALAGGYTDGVSVADSFASGTAAAAALDAP